MEASSSKMQVRISPAKIRTMSMTDYTTDRSHPDLKRGADETPVKQSQVYLVLSEKEIKRGFVRPLRDAYVHKECGGQTKMGLPIAETFARNPNFYGGTYCEHCEMHRPLYEFVWDDGSTLGT